MIRAESWSLYNRLLMTLTTALLTAGCAVSSPHPGSSNPSSSLPNSSAAASQSSASQGSAYPRDLESFHMVDASVGWAASQSAIYRTTNGGSSWVRMLTVATRGGSAAAFLDASHAWIGVRRADGIHVLRTEDSGLTWADASVSLPADLGHSDEVFPYPSSLYFADVAHGWLLATYGTGMGDEHIALIATKDGGRTWDVVATSNVSSASSLPEEGVKSGIMFATSAMGWITGDQTRDGWAPIFDVTADAGKTWRRVDLASPVQGTPSRTDPPVFVTPTVGFEVATFSGNPGVTAIYTSNDAGRSWRKVSQLPASLTVSFADTRHGVATDGAKVWDTTDGGVTWHMHALASALGEVRELDFIPPTDGWARTTPLGGGPSLLWRTTDGGKTWTSLPE